MQRATLALAVVLAFGATLIGQTKPGAQPGDNLQRQIDAAIADRDVKDFVLCQARAAVWGRYSATIEVDSLNTSDKKARVFEVTAGRVSVQTPANDRDTRGSREGIVSIATKEEAFARGVPFFIGDVRFSPPDSLTFTVWSNPIETIRDVRPRFQVIERRSTGFRQGPEVVDRTSISSSPEPQTVTVKEDRLEDWVLSLIAMNRDMRCLLSNEVELTPLLKK